MKFLPLVWAGLWRKKLRTILTLLSIVVAFMLFGTLQSVSAVTGNLLAAAHVDRLFVLTTDNATRMPPTYLERIAGTSGVTAVAALSGGSAEYQDPKNKIAVLSIDVESFSKVYPELDFAPEQIAGMKGTRTAAIAGSRLVEKFGWKIGDRLPLRSPDGREWAFDIVGILGGGSADFLNVANHVLVNYDFYAEATGDPSVGAYVAVIADPTRATPVGEAIDRLFANSPAETETRSEKEFAETAVKQMGDITFFINAIVASAFFTLLFLTGTTMWQSVRDRIPEFGVLKTLGFSDDGVMSLIVAETLMLCLVGACIGLLAVLILLPLVPGGPSGEVQGSMPPIVAAWGAVLAVALALASGLPAAWRVRQLAIVDALAGS